MRLTVQDAAAASRQWRLERQSEEARRGGWVYYSPKER